MRSRTHLDPSGNEIQAATRSTPKLLLDPSREPRVSSRRSADEQCRCFAGSGRQRRQNIINGEVPIRLESHAELIGTGDGSSGASPAEERGENALATVGSHAVAAVEKQSSSAETNAPFRGDVRVQIRDPPDLARGRNTPYYVGCDCGCSAGDGDVGNRIDADSAVKSDERVLMSSVTDRGPWHAIDSEVVDRPDVGFRIRIHDGEVASS
jgi:hypothetical protein